VSAYWVPLKRIASLNPETLGDHTGPGTEFRYIDISATGRGRLVGDPEPMTFESAPSRARRVLRQGDTILSTVRTYLRAVWTLRDPEPDLVASTGFVCLRPRPGVEPRYLGWLAQSDLVVEEVVARSVGVSYPAINPSDVGLIKVPLPAIGGQREIADFLDRETARIDALLSSRRRQMQLLEDRFWVAFARRVERTETRSTPLRRVLTSLIDGPFGSAFSSSAYVDEGAAVVRLGNIGFATYNHADQARIPEGLYEEFSAYAITRGDLLIAGLGDDRNHAGRACVAPDLGHAIVKGKCFRGRVNDQSSAGFLAFLLSSPLGAAAMGVSGRGSTRAMINLDVVKSTEMPLPHREAQDAIVAETTAQRRLTQAAIASAQRQTDLLAERRQALITVAVTGQIEVPVAA